VVKAVALPLAVVVQRLQGGEELARRDDGGIGRRGIGGNEEEGEE
jgi:hypothetical protein